MTKKDYIRIAEIIKYVFSSDVKPEHQKVELINYLTSYFNSTYQKFDEAKFKEICK